MTIELSEQELRVLGCLVEKELTTPQQYPLTLNALTVACNQSSNRFPVVHYEEHTVEEAVTSAKTRGLARFVHPSHGRSAIRYAHTLEEALDVDRRQTALLAVLILRGPQTPGELRSRTERMAGFEGLSDIESELDRLAGKSEPLVVRLARMPGQKEVRYAHLLGSSQQGSEAQTTGPPTRGSGHVVGEQTAGVGDLRRNTMSQVEDSEGHRIVVGVDGSPSSKRALKWAARQAELTNATLEVVTTWEFPTSFGWALPFPADFDPERDARRAVESTIEEVLGHAPAVGVAIKVVEGHPAPVLVDLSRGADMLVVGSRGHGEFSGMLLGSVSEHCVTNCHCPVLVLRDGRDE